MGNYGVYADSFVLVTNRVEIPDMDACRTADHEIQQAEGCELVCDEATGIEENEVLLGRKTWNLKAEPPEMEPIGNKSA